MPRNLKDFLRGMGSVLEIFPSGEPYHFDVLDKTPEEQAADTFAAVGRDLTNALGIAYAEVQGESADEPKRQTPG